MVRVRAVMAIVFGAGVAVAGCRSGGAGANPETAPSGAPMMSAANNALPPGVSTAMVAMGDSLFAAGSCQRCHGVAGVGGQNGPPLTTGPWLQADGSYDSIIGVITNGVPQEKLKDPARRPMRARGGPMNLTDEQVRAAAAYVFSISRAKG